MVFNRTSKFTVTGKVYCIKGDMNCGSTNIISLTICMKCLGQYVGSAIKVNSKIRIHKSDIKPKRDWCGTSRHFNSKCCHSSIPLYIYVSISLRKYVVFMITVTVKIFYGIEKNNNSPNYLQMQKVWIFIVRTPPQCGGYRIFKILNNGSVLRKF